MTKEEKKAVRAKEQARIMLKHHWTLDDWLYWPNGKNRFKKSYL